ncbi:hypothetical protein DYBT9275_00443 [Dyadobacter sp. CECT 9275]|uniref:Uncharacterized protein n=1 Tax=Dyadobacter helix TaxID=2822344 RepID=A0A916J9F2_9BACT|nr:hypothetical protein [Dyadobacter sp. CECT 9275]CAG4990064.1 hypothetical protein DYBT9275_00443 [Dyadobacter sp. CECT 9275]
MGNEPKPENEARVQIQASLDGLNVLAHDVKNYYARLIRQNNEVPYMIEQLSRDIHNLEQHVGRFEQNVSLLSKNG